MLPINEIEDRFLSIESATLELLSPAPPGGHRQIYGDIRINGQIYDRAISLYKRTAFDPQTSSSNNLMNLTLCGPEFYLFDSEPTFLYVDLHEANTGPLMVQRVPIKSHLRTLRNPNIPIEIVATGNDCVLRFCMISLTPSVFAATEIVLERSDTMWLVSGTVSAVQESVYEDRYAERTFPLFSRPESSPVRVFSHGGIPLDRHSVIAPLKKDLDMVRQLNYRPDDPVHGQGSSITIHVDLKLVTHGGDDHCFLSGALEFVIDGAYPVGHRFEQYLVGAVKVAVGEKHYCISSDDVGINTTDRQEEIESFVSDEHQMRMLTLKVSITPINHRYTMHHMDPAIYDEPWEDDLPLYVHPDDEFYANQA